MADSTISNLWKQGRFDFVKLWRQGKLLDWTAVKLCRQKDTFIKELLLLPQLVEIFCVEQGL